MEEHSRCSEQQHVEVLSGPMVAVAWGLRRVRRGCAATIAELHCAGARGTAACPATKALYNY
eukprot:7304861-Prymnesium_polylepis.1